jgi:hypothetical protein
LRRVGNGKFFMVSGLLNEFDLLFSYVLIFLLSYYFYDSKGISIFGLRGHGRHIGQGF